LIVLVRLLRLLELRAPIGPCSLRRGELPLACGPLVGQARQQLAYVFGAGGDLLGRRLRLGEPAGHLGEARLPLLEFAYEVEGAHEPTIAGRTVVGARRIAPTWNSQSPANRGLSRSRVSSKGSATSWPIAASPARAPTPAR